MSEVTKRRFAYACLFLSGTASLVEEAAWHRYLSVLLGAQARATAITLALFLGGMCAGYFWYGRRSRKSPTPWRDYALAEIGLGAWAFLFPLGFRALFKVSPFLYVSLGLNGIALDLVLSSFLLFPPAFLMGAALPLVTQAMSERLESASRVHALAYGLNTLGGAFGSLLAGYVLLPTISLSAVSRIAAVGNGLVAIALTFAFRGARSEISVEPARTPVLRWNRYQATLLLIGALSGFYLFTLETVLVRLFGLSTGASDYAFALIASLFLLGIALGGIAARSIARAHSGHLFWNQVAVVVFLTLLYLSGDCWSYGAHVLRALLRDLPANFYVYQVLLALALSICVLPVLAVSGLTLPLCFHLLKEGRHSLGERVGQLYAVNAAGCVLGSLIGGYAIFHWLNLDEVLKVCLALNVFSVLVAAYLYFPDHRPGLTRLVAGGLILTCGAIATWRLPLYDKERFLQPFRFSEPVPATFEGPTAWGEWFRRLIPRVEWIDGPSSSIGLAVTAHEGREFGRSLFVNGKSDGNTEGDGLTAAMLGHLPALLARRPERACVIGLGTGITIGTLARYPEVKRIDVAEISETAIRKAAFFDAYDGGVSKSAKVHFHALDAFRFVGGARRPYDVIVSEPSNPWASGVENLYSLEFYRRVRGALDDDGVFVQWIHAYSFNDDLLRLVTNTLREVFPEASLFQLTLGDFAIVAPARRLTLVDLQRAAKRLESHPELHRQGVDRIESLLALQVAPPRLVRAMSVGAGEQTLESPHLSAAAARALFVGDWARPLVLRREFLEYFDSISESLLSIYEGSAAPSPQVTVALRRTLCDSPFRPHPELCQELAIRDRLLGGEPGSRGEARALPPRELAPLDEILRPVGKTFSDKDTEALDSAVELYRKYASPVSRFSPEILLHRADLCLSKVPPDSETYGKCLLVKAEVFETRDRRDPRFLQTVREFLAWAPHLKSESPAYARLQKAREILEKALASSES